MINSIIITNHLNESITMILRSPEQSGFFIRSIDGLGPPKADINLSETAGLDGSSYNSARASTRNIVLRLGFLPGPQIEDVRQLSYKYFPLKKPVTIQIDGDNRVVKTIGYVESNEPDIFSKQQVTVVSLICPNSYLLDEFESVTVFSSITPLFEFPFSNESLVTPLLEMSELDLQTIKSVVYEGDAEIGMIIHIHASGSASDLVITDAVTLETLSIDSAKLIALTGDDIIVGDDIYISTVKGDKYATLVRGSSDINILSTLGDDPTWFTLEKGDNIFAYTATGIANLQIEIINDVAYEGI